MKERLITPPKWIDRFLEWYSDDEYVDEIIGDMHEFFYLRVKQNGAAFARIMYFFDALKSINPLNMKKDYPAERDGGWLGFLNASFNGFRNLRKRKLTTGINLFGFTLGLTSFVLFFNFYQSQRSYDSFHKHYSEIYRVVQNSASDGQIYGIAKTPFPLGPFLQNDYPSVKQTRLYQTFRKTPFLNSKSLQKSFYEEKLFFTDSTFFEVFTYELIQGNPKTALKEPHSMVITEEMAKKLFGDVNPMNEVLWLEGKMPFTITGVAKQPSNKAHFSFNALASLQDISSIFDATGNSFPHDGWYWTAVHTYLLLPEHLDKQAFDELLVDFKGRHLPEDYTHVDSFKLQALSDIHLGSNLAGEIQANRNKSDLQLFLIAGIFILSIAVVNFINISTSQSTERLKELSLKTIFGASKRHLALQIVLESVMLTLFAMVISLLLAVAALPSFNVLLETDLVMNDLWSVEAIAIYLSTFLVIGILAGMYPAFYTVAMVKSSGPRLGLLARGRYKSPVLRKVLVVFQFEVATLMILFTLIIRGQYGLMINKDLGFDTEEVFMMPIKGSAVKANVNVFKERLLKSPRFRSATTVSDVLGEKTVFGRFQIGDNSEDTRMNMFSVGFDFLETFEIELTEGRNYNPAITSDSNAYLINQAALALFDNGDWQNTTIEGNPVIGVIDDFHYANLFNEMSPLLIRINDGWANFLAVKMTPGDLMTSTAELADLWSEFESDRPFDGFFLKTAIQKSYQDESQLRSLLSVFSFLSIALAMLGLFALVNYNVKLRLKEMGIRKVLGASFSHMIVLIFKDFALLFVLACVISFSAGAYLVNDWLSSFPYRIDLGVEFFGMTTLIVLVITVLTITLSGRKAVFVNPVETLAEE